MAPLPITHLHHLAIVTCRTEESVKFYTQVLGFRPIQRPNFDFHGAWLLGYGIQIHIIENTAAHGERSAHIDTRMNHVAFAVSDHAPVRKRLIELGIVFAERVNAGGIPQIFFHDPDGNHIEIGIYPPHPPFLDA
jgi:catechol 2,3-dioxygenase-like lactoylglutathione lyase family enzyme